MTIRKINPKVDFYFQKANRWQEAINLLRWLVLDVGLTEELKWGVPCYTYDGANVVLIHIFKEYCALLFVKGALLDDPHHILVQQTKNVQAARQIRFTDAEQITQQEAWIQAYLKAAIVVEKSGQKVSVKKTEEFEMPEEFRMAIAGDAQLQQAFYALTPGRQRAYLLYFADAKQSKTRIARIDKYRSHILNGKGLND